MDVKAWLETSGLTVKEEQYLAPPSFPYVVFNDNAEAGYHALTIKNINHNLTVDLYTAVISTTDEDKIVALVTSLPQRYTRTRRWDDNENCFITTFQFTLEEIEV